MNEIYKSVSESLSSDTRIVLSGDANGVDRLFGGRLLEWVDMLAGAVGIKHAETNVVTRLIDSIEFKKPAYIGDIITMTGRLTYVGNTSMEVLVDTYAKSLNKNAEHINRAFVVLVAVDASGRGVPVPKLKLETDVEREENERAKKRTALRKQRAVENY